jgi:predicted NAD-dependent protein-ADP-ribosyltransferase YbiA (DUF1768 family)
MSTPQKSECPAATGHSANQHTDGAIFNEVDAERKRFATMAARAAIKGHTLQRLGSGFLLSRWGNVRHFVDLDTAEAALQALERGQQ